MARRQFFAQFGYPFLSKVSSCAFLNFASVRDMRFGDGVDTSIAFFVFFCGVDSGAYFWRFSGSCFSILLVLPIPAQEFWIKPVSYLCFEAECVNIIKRGLKIQERQGRQHACRISAEVSVLGGYMDGSLHKEAIPFLDACSQGSHRRHRKSRVFFHLLYRHNTEARHSTLS